MTLQVVLSHLTVFFIGMLIMYIAFMIEWHDVD